MYYEIAKMLAGLADFLPFSDAFRTAVSPLFHGQIVSTSPAAYIVRPWRCHGCDG